MPVRGPAFVHDLGLALRREVIGLVADDREDIALPRLKRGMVDQEQQDILLRMLGSSLALFLLFAALLFLRLEGFGRIDVVVHVVLALEARQAELIFLLLLEIVARMLFAAADGG